MNPINLRPYQERTLADLDDWFVANPEGHPIVHACVGAGKSVMLAEFCRRAVLGYPGYRARILMLVPSKELAEQNLAKLAPLMTDIYIGVVSASVGRKDDAYDKDVVVATVGSVVKHPGRLGRIDIVLVDECHLANRKNVGQYRQLIAGCQRFNPELRVVGWTGTPYRGDGVWLTEGSERLFTDIAARVTIRELLDAGFLSPLVTAETGIQIDASDVKQRNGDFVIADLAKRLDDAALTEKIVEQIVALGAERKRWLVYGVTVAHAEHLASAIRARGVSVAVVSAETPKRDRARIVRDFKVGRIRCICNVAVLTTGFDVPELDLIALVRNTRSPVLYTQIAGRGMRIADGKSDCLWLDFTDSTAVMGPIDQIKGKSEPKPAQADAPYKICPGCGTSCGTATLVCAVCGHQFPPPKPALNDAPSAANPLTKVGFHTYPVSHVTYASYINRKKPGSPPTLKVTYWYGMKRCVSEWVSLQHEGYARAKAEKWWRERFGNNFPAATMGSFLGVPETVSEALLLVEWLKRPTSVVVKEGEDWPELIRCIFEQEAVAEES